MEVSNMEFFKFPSVKQFNSALSKVAREWFLKELNKV